MSFLFIGSTGNHAGMSLLTWAIARRLVERGLNVGFMKPFGTQPVRIDGVWTDHDAFLLKEALNIPDDVRFIAATPLSYPVEDSYDEAAREKLGKRTRKSLKEIAYANKWGNPL